jgi:hypothetical protein
MPINQFCFIIFYDLKLKYSMLYGALYYAIHIFVTGPMKKIDAIDFSF